MTHKCSEPFIERPIRNGLDTNHSRLQTLIIDILAAVPGITMSTNDHDSSITTRDPSTISTGSSVSRMTRNCGSALTSEERKRLIPYLDKCVCKLYFWQPPKAGLSGSAEYHRGLYEEARQMVAEATEMPIEQVKDLDWHFQRWTNSVRRECFSAPHDRLPGR